MAFPTAELIETVVCRANTDGDAIFVGVEDDGTPTGLHRNNLDVPGMAAMIANRTLPPVAVVVTRLEIQGGAVARIDVPKSTQITATTDDVLKRRRLQLDGRPACVPFLPHESRQRHSQLGLADPSSADAFKRVGLVERAGRIGNMNDLRRRSPLPWAPSTGHKVPDSDVGRPRSPRHRRLFPELKQGPHGKLGLSQMVGEVR